MYASTEDLLRIRDGEPVDAKVRAAVDADAELREEVARLRKTREELEGLPDFQPPPGAWDRIVEASAVRPAPGWRWPLRGAIAAAVAAVAIVLVSRAPRAPEMPLPSTTVAEMPVPQTGASALDRRIATPTYASLVAESARLEQQLIRIGDRPRLINAETAAAITGLQDQIALIDAQLMYSRALQPRELEALQETRVDLMSALLGVRYAHAQRSGF